MSHALETNDPSFISLNIQLKTSSYIKHKTTERCRVRVCFHKSFLQLISMYDYSIQDLLSFSSIIDFSVSNQVE